MMRYLSGYAVLGCAPYDGKVAFGYRLLALLCGAWRFAEVGLVYPSDREQKLIVPVRYGALRIKCPCRKNYLALGLHKQKDAQFTTVVGDDLRESGYGGGSSEHPEPLFAFPLFV